LVSKLRAIFNAIFCYYRNGVLEPIGEWKLKDCIAVHKLLRTVLVDDDAALSKYHCLYAMNFLGYIKYVCASDLKTCAYLVS